ncbi:GDSL esterase/lipase At1g54790-like [Apium graveolens]|uniref:GDSL esterase/lipase At1g54790-like n=1 Tax=Apium graveolens TaxID=4045 RepID=UPI003D793FC6
MVGPSLPHGGLWPTRISTKTCLPDLILATISLPLYLIGLPLSYSFDFNYQAVFNFGDSNSDTGGLIAGVGEHLYPPYGQTYFKNPSGRFCNGRLNIDFLMDSMDMPFLNPYMDAIGVPSFKKGCNFTVASSSILPATTSSVSPFSFAIQVAQFVRLKARVLEILKKDEKQICRFFTIDPKTLVPLTVQKLYDEGARNFWIHNTGPLGCLRQNIAKFGTDPSKLDELGCVPTHNQASKLLNLQLHALCTKLRLQYTDANVTFIDIFTMKSNLIANYSKYGFKQPLEICCGYGGPPLNYDSRIACGQTQILNGNSANITECSDNTEYVNWDRIHYTDAANLHVSSQILTGKFSDPPFADKMPFPVKINF